MKKFLLSIIVVFLLTSVCFAELYFVINSQTKEVESVYESYGKEIESKDIHVATGSELVTLQGELADYKFDLPITSYLYKNKKFIMNQAKINAEEAKKNEAEEIAAEKKMIDDKIQQLAIDTLKAEGKTFKHF